MQAPNAPWILLLGFLHLTAAPAARAGFSQPKAAILTDTPTLSEAFADCSPIAAAFRTEVKMEGTHWSWTALLGDWDSDALPHDILITLIRHRVTHDPPKGEESNVQLATQDFSAVFPRPGNTLPKGPFPHDYGLHPGTTEDHHDFLVVRFDDMQNGWVRMSVVLSHSNAAPALTEPLTGERRIGRRELRLGDAFSEHYEVGAGNRVTRTWRLVALDRDVNGNDVARCRQLPGFLRRADGTPWLEASRPTAVEVEGTLTQVGTNSTARVAFGAYGSEATFYHPTQEGQRVVLSEAIAMGAWMLDLETARITGQRQVSSNRLDGLVIESSATVSADGQLSPTVHRQADNGQGTIFLPPDPGVDGDGYISLTDFHLIRVEGMGTVDLVARHKGLRCLFSPVGIDTNCIVDATPGDPRDGEEEEFESDLELRMLPTGELAQLIPPRVLVVPMRARIRTSPRFPGQPVQHVDAQVLDFTSTNLLAPDPLFASLKVVAGTGHGLPSVGKTTLTRQGTDFEVHSYFDVNYRLEWVGAGLIEGSAGTNVGTVRMELGRAPLPVFTWSPAVVRNGADLLGGTVVLTTAAEGEPPVTYQWFRNNERLPGESGPILRLPDLKETDAGRYFVRAYNEGGYVESEPVQVAVPDDLGFTSVRRAGDGIEMVWRSDAMLESSDSVMGPWLAVPEATSRYRLESQGAARFFRLRR